MKFDYTSYEELLDLLKKELYYFADYHNYQNFERSVILRHDVDTNLELAVKMSEVERQNEVSATYFVLLTSDFYNAASKKSIGLMREIEKNGGAIGLHFDEVCYSDVPKEELVGCIQREANILSNILEERVDVVSMHRPSKWVLENDIEIPGMINSYSKTFFKGFKYVSDSRRYWREDVRRIVISGEYARLHILTHPFWYREIELSASVALKDQIEFKRKECYRSLNENIRDLQQFINIEDC